MKRPAPVFVCLVVFLSVAVLRAQGNWYDDYENGERAFQKHDYAKAEQLLLKAMRNHGAPTDRGIDVKRYSQQFGVIPEYYLAVMCSEGGRLDEAYLYAQTVTTTKDYFTRGDPRLKKMEDIVSAWNDAHPPAIDRGVRLTPPALIGSDVVGSYYALLIGINDYKYQPPLKTAARDATDLADLLHKDFDFTTRILLNGDATELGIKRALRDYVNMLGAKDNLLIYYAGHGYWNEKSDRVFWLPVDADKDRIHWIIADDITADIQEMSARHVLLVSDSCYAGGMTRGAELDEDKRDRVNYLRKMIQFPSRSLMASGDIEPVSDGLGGGHSVFASALLRYLGKPREDPAFTAAALFQEVQQAVAGRSAQTPKYTQIRNASLDLGDKGDFVFVRHTAGR